MSTAGTKKSFAKGADTAAANRRFSRSPSTRALPPAPSPETRAFPLASHNASSCSRAFKIVPRFHLSYSQGSRFVASDG
jgi:hypothetical protein